MVEVTLGHGGVQCFQNSTVLQTPGCRPLLKYCNWFDRKFGWFPALSRVHWDYGYRITERLRLEGNFGGHLVQPLSSSRTTYSWFPRTVSRQLLSIPKEGDSTISLGNFCQSLVTLTVKKVFPDVQTEPPVFQFGKDKFHTPLSYIC